MTQLPLGKLLYVEWEDHSSHGTEWIGAKEIGIAPSLCRSVGWLFHEDAKAITLVSTHAEYPGEFVPHARGAQTIIKSCIVRRRTLVDPGKKR